MDEYAMGSSTENSAFFIIKNPWDTDIFTVTANLAGIPAISIPVGLTQQRLPIGFQILGNFFQESLLFKLAFLLEKK